MRGCTCTGLTLCPQCQAWADRASIPRENREQEQCAPSYADVSLNATALRQHPRLSSHPYRSRTEQRYADLLDVWQHEGTLRRWRYEAMRLALAPRTTLTIDFMLTRPDGRIELHEVKGFAREDAMVKLKTAAALYPEWRIVLVRWQNQAWTWRDIPCA